MVKWKIFESSWTNPKDRNPNHWPSGTLEITINVNFGSMWQCFYHQDTLKITDPQDPEKQTKDPENEKHNCKSKRGSRMTDPKACEASSSSNCWCNWCLCCVSRLSSKSISSMFFWNFSCITFNWNWKWCNWILKKKTSLLLLLLTWHCDAPYKMYNKLKSACLIRKTSSEKVYFQVSSISLGTNWQISESHRQFVPTFRTSHSYSILDQNHTSINTRTKNLNNNHWYYMYINCTFIALSRYMKCHPMEQL